eukprot:TRINITY_DN5263_c0_g1_i1.p1 TRINITY_DN5263_c0_g1~~TRINITY_DN5263_c0_g1_i1.p1  ORF type:complete len:233 (+),score=59.55 TRINITY_DN5263_c0_g1_i1:63-761(+)
MRPPAAALALLGAAAAVDPPPAGSLFCGGVPGILSSNLTVLPGSRMTYFSDIKIVSVVVDCPREPFDFQPDTGVMDIAQDMANPSDCFAQASARDGGSTFTFTYDGDATVGSKNSKWGAVDLKRASGASCHASFLGRARSDPPPAGSKYCGGPPGAPKVNLTVPARGVIAVETERGACPPRAVTLQGGAGALDLSDCAAAANGSMAFAFDGAAAIVAKHSKWGPLILRSSAC